MKDKLQIWINYKYQETLPICPLWIFKSRTCHWGTGKCLSSNVWVAWTRRCDGLWLGASSVFCVCVASIRGDVSTWMRARYPGITKSAGRVWICCQWEGSTWLWSGSSDSTAECNGWSSIGLGWGCGSLSIAASPCHSGLCYWGTCSRTLSGPATPSRSWVSYRWASTPGSSRTFSWSAVSPWSCTSSKWPPPNRLFTSTGFQTGCCLWTRLAWWTSTCPRLMSARCSFCLKRLVWDSCPWSWGRSLSWPRTRSARNGSTLPRLGGGGWLASWSRRINALCRHRQRSRPAKG